MFSKLAYSVFEQSIRDYHQFDSVDQPINNPFPKDKFEHLLYLKNWIDTVQWHFEDIIRDPQIDPVAALKRELASGKFYILSSPKKGAVVDLGYLWSDLHEIQTYVIPSIEKNAKLSPNGKFLVNEMKKNVQDALTNLGTAMSQIATK